MTDTETPVPEDAIWPVPEDSLMEPRLVAMIDHVLAGLVEAEKDLLAFVKAAPVKRHPTHPTYIHDLAWTVDTLERIIDRAKAIQAEVGEHLAKAVPFGTPRIAYPGLRPLTPRWGGDRKEWANDLLAEDVKPRILMADPEAGEMRTPSEVLDLCFSVVSLNGSNAKVTGLRALGLDPDDYCKKTPAPPTIQVTKDAAEKGGA